jgi:phosphatidate cytidylyltransferase
MSNNALSRIFIAAIAIPVFLWGLGDPKVSIFMFLVIGSIMLIEYITIITRSNNKLAWLFPGVIGILMSIFPLVIIRINDETGYILVWFFITLWISDTFAMITGKLLGGRKLCPKISFNKTWSGVLGGILAASYGSFLIAGYLQGEYNSYYSGLGALVALSSQLSDLVESAFKRSFNIKDSSNLLLGHGGFLDRFDGLLFSSGIILLLNYYEIIP